MINLSSFKQSRRIYLFLTIGLVLVSLTGYYFLSIDPARSQHLPAPFLGYPFPANFETKVTTGWYYNQIDTEKYGVHDHKSIDLDAPKGTPILAAADGLAIASFTEYRLVDETGQPRLIDGKEIFAGVGLTVQVHHGNGTYTQYSHLDSYDRNIPFYEPTSNEKGGLGEAKEFRAPVAQYGKEIPARRVRAGEEIGKSGATGLGIGERTYEHWKAGTPYQSHDIYHLHFVVFGERTGEKQEAPRWDPFGINSVELKHYPTDRREWSGLQDSLWLP